MKFYLHFILIAALSLVLSPEETFCQCTGLESLAFSNPTFNGTPGDGIVPPPWSICMPGQTPDTQPGEWGVTLPAVVGTTYIGLVAEPSANWQEGVAQQLPTPLIAGATYTFTLYLANSDATGGGIVPGCAELQVWAGFSACDDNTGTGVLVWASGNITPYDTWQLYTVTFTATENFTWMMFRVHSLGCSSQPYILLDDIGTIEEIPTIDSTNVTCNGDNNGTATVVALGPNTPFTYSWSTTPPSTDSTVTGLAPGNYMVTVTDGQGCTSTASVGITQPAQIVLTPDIVEYGCGGSGSLRYSGSAYISYAGGTPPFTFLWSNGDTSQSNPDLFSGTYGVTATDSNGCTATASIVITQPNGITDTVTTVQATCGHDNGSATVTPLSGTPPYKYIWSDSATTATITNLGAGSYTVTVSDDSGCVAQGTAIVTLTNGFTVTASAVNTTCGANNASAWAVIATGSDPPYTYQWSNTGSTDTITNLPGGTYSITVMGSGGCSASASVSVSSSTGVALGATTIRNILCNGDSTGSITTSTTSGIPPFTYNWAPGSFGHTDSIGHLAAGTYTVTVTDRGGCTGSASYNVTQATAIVIDTAVVTPIYCTSTGSIVITATGGSGDLTYTWLPDEGNTDSIANLTAGTYSLTITDTNSCSVTASYTLTPGPSALTIDSSKVNNVTCNDAGNGSIVVYIGGAIGPVTYSWNIPALSNSLSGLNPGTFSVTATDSVGCSVSASYTITQPSALVITSDTITNVSCFGGSNGSIALTDSGGTGLITYTWSNADSTATIGGLTVGAYSVTLQDANGCQLDSSFSITQPTAIVIDSTVITQAGCTVGGTIVVTAQGGTGILTYSWSNGDSGDSIGNLAGAVYTLTITDQNACSLTASDTVTAAPGAISFTPPVLVEPTCNGGHNGSITDSATGGNGILFYLWSTSATNDSITGLSAGPYSLTVSDAVPCSASISFVLGQPAAVTFNPPIITEPGCFGGDNGSITVSAGGGTGPITYAWNYNNDSTATITGLSQGSYSVTATDSVGCSTSTSYTVNQPAAVTFGPPVIDSVLCYGGNTGSITATASGGTGTIIFTWSNTETGATDTALTAGAYMVTATDSLGCSAITSYMVGQPTPLVVDTAVLTQANCSIGGCIAVTASGGTGTLSYSWSNGGHTSTICNLPIGPYTLTITDQNGCSITTSDTVTTIPGTLALDSASITEPKCHGDNNGSILVFVTDSNSTVKFTWSNNASDSTAIDSNLATGIYSVTVTDTLGCSDSGSYIVRQPLALIIDSSKTIPGQCNSGACIHVYAYGGTGNLNYEWSNLDTGDSICGLPNGIITLLVLDQNQCSTTATYLIQTGVNAVAFGPPAITQPACNGDSGSISVTVTSGSNPITYEWNYQHDSTATITSLAGGTYAITITDANGCTADTAYNINNAPSAITNITLVITQSTCTQGGSIYVVDTGGTGTLSYTWTGTSQTGDSITGLSPGTYTLTVTDQNGCSLTASYMVTNIPTALLLDSASIVEPKCFGGANGSIVITATDSSSSIEYAWSNNAGDTTAADSNLVVGTYTVTLTDTVGCLLTATYNVGQPLAITIDSDVITPAGCTPTGCIHVYASGGTGNLTYGWSTLAIGDSICGLSGGPITLLIVDHNLCSATATYTIPTNSMAFGSPVLTQPLCNGGSNGSITITTTGGAAPVTYKWNYQNDSTTTITGLPAGTYMVTATDVNGCSASTSYVLTNPPAISITDSLITQASCAGGGSIYVVASGGTGTLTYTWTGTPQTGDSITGLSAGPYILTIMDANSCSLTQSFTVPGASGVVVIDTGIVTNVKCNGGNTGAITVTASGGSGLITFRWNYQGATTPTITGLIAAQYCVTATDANSCSASKCFTVGEPSAITYSFETTEVNCTARGSIYVIASGGTGALSYSWSGTNQTGDSITGLSAGIYTVTITDSIGCSVSASDTVGSVPGAINITENQALNPTCVGGGSITIGATGGIGVLSYRWNYQNDSSSTLINLPAGIYTVTVSDLDGCSATVSDTLTAPGSFTVNVNFNPIICQGTSDSAIAIPNGGLPPYSYAWSNGPITQVNEVLPAGAFCVTVTDHNSCTASTCDSIGQDPLLHVTEADSIIHCVYPGIGQVTITAQGGSGALIYEINSVVTGPIVNDDGIFGLQPAGNYTFSVADTLGCAITGTFTTPLGNPLNSFVATGDSVSCPGVRNGTIIVSSLPVDSTGGPFSYSINGGTGYQSSDTFNALASGNYLVIVSNAGGCLDTAYATVYSKNALDSFNVTSDSTSCYGAHDGGLVLAPVTDDSTAGPFTYSLNGGAYKSSGTFDSLGGGTYQVVVVNGAGCPDTLSEVVYQPGPGSVGFNPDTITTEATYGVQLNPLVNNIENPEFTWTPALGLSCSNCADPTAIVVTPTLYYVTVFDSLNTQCSATDSIWVLLKGQFAMPNAFTPNGDGKNDFFMPVQYSYVVIKTFHIYNRWGQMVHNSTDPWDGNFDGKPQPPGTYVYYIEVEYPDPTYPGTTDTQKQEGAVTLLR